MTGYRESFHGHARQREGASLTIPLVISFGEPFRIGLGRHPTIEDRVGSFAAGLFAGPVVIDSFGQSDCLQIDFTPQGARRFFRFPMHELAGRMADLGDVLGPEGASLRERLANTASWRKRFAIAEHHVAQRIAEPLPSGLRIRAAYERIEGSGGRIAVSRLAEFADCSRKHLNNAFREEIGLSPKSLARIVRFQRTMRVARSTDLGWAEIAAECGYADQAHMAREFQALSDSTPSAWRSSFNLT
ncbi:helix-turn-helix transcriptional regulator [Pseudaminobacter sp. 19-2017]|uniref:Helix-turn-helix transcriptional regulator n=2 Tax=Pseudaminobacter soli (ex Zhang et al. 2022) TaxID=2831468 RepID=A0A942I8H3_9HYPH|nr:helix-turn-helix transcriptional regulator [Pseudaminobacter soli]